MADEQQKRNPDAGPSHAPDLTSIIGNMVLAHEMIVNDDFQLKGFQDNTLEKTIKDVVHRAFWDILEEQISQEPPQYERALHLLEEIKETLLSLMPQQTTGLKQQVEEVLDLELIKQEVSYGCFDLGECAKFIIIVMGKLCAPQRDEELNKLKDVEGIVPTLREIFAFLDLMKMDMANFQLQKLKPYLMQQSIDYERGKFEEYLKANPDGTAMTKEWLRNAVNDVKRLITKSISIQNETKTGGEKKLRPIPKISTSLVLTHAYLRLLEWQDGFVFPETLLMDELRLAEMSHMFSRLCLIGSVMLITSNVVGQHLSTDARYVKKLKDQLFVLLDGVPNRKLPNLVPNLYEQVITSTKRSCEEKEISQLTEEQESLLKRQISSVLNEKNSVYQLIKSRIRDYALLCMTSERTPRHTEAPLALANVQDELKILAGRFSRLITHNRNVYYPIYNDIIENLIQEANQEESEATNASEAHDLQMTNESEANIASD